jgi:thiol-disulfide isomerase/thioredoxin
MLQRSLFSLVLLATSTLGSGPLGAWAEGAQLAAAATDNQAAQPARQVIERARRVYNSQRTFQASVLHESARETVAGEVVKFQSSLQIRFAHPDRLILESDRSRLVLEGQRLLLLSHRYGAYSQRLAPDPLALEPLSEELSLLDFAGVSVGAFLLQRDLPNLLPFVVAVDRAEPERRDGRPGMRVHGRGDLARRNDVGTHPVSMWFDDETGMLMEVHFDLTEHYQRMLGGPDDPPPPPGQSDERHHRVTATVTFTDIAINEMIADDLWRVEVPDGYRQVDTLHAAVRQPRPRHELVGEHVPDLAFETLSGEKLSLRDLRGRVVVLDFWALWCGPCLAAMPHVQALAEAHHDKPLTIIGINRDSEGAAERILAYIDRRGYTFRQVHDPEGKIAEEFIVGGIPHMVFIDRGGIIREVKVGYVKGEEERMGAIVEALLAGDPVPELSADWVKDPAAPLEESHVERLQRQGRAARTGSLLPDQIIHIDIDGDGSEEIVIPRFDGQLFILSAEGERRRQIVLDTDGGTQFLRSLIPMRIGSELHWLAQFAYSPEWPMERRWVGLFDAEGQRIWIHEPPLGENRNCTLHVTTGDLTGDGTDEIIVSLSTHTILRFVGVYHAPVVGEQAAYLIILDSAGRVLVQKHVGERAVGTIVIPRQGSRPGAVLAHVDGALRRFEFGDLPEGESPGAP